MKKILSLFLAAVLCISSLSVTAYAQADKTAASLSQLSTIRRVGLPASAMYTKDGDYTMELSGGNIYKNIKIPCIQDWSEYNAMKMWVYSPKEVNASMSIALISDNKSTSALDYYVGTFYLTKMGWNEIVMPYVGDVSEFYQSGTPKGMDKIDRIELWPNYGGNMPDSSLELYFDKITLTNIDLSLFAPSEDTSDSSGGAKEAEAFSPFTLGAGNASGGKPVIEDWTPYNTLVFEMTSQAASMRDWWMVICSDNPNTSGLDYYHIDLTANWVGDLTWKIDLDSALSYAGTPLGLNKITGLEFWSYDNVDNDETRIEVKRAYLTNVDYSELFKPEYGNYVVDAVLEKDFKDYDKLISERFPGEKAHPRIFFNNDELNQMREWTKTDEYMRKSYAKLIQACEELIKTGALKRANSNNSLLQMSVGYLLSGDVRYKDWIWESITGIIESKSFNPIKQYLSVGDTLRNMAYTYDMMYNEWTEEQRQIVRNAMMHYGIENTLCYTRAYNKFAGTDGGNWGQIIMSGLGAAGLALAGEGEEYTDIVNETINRSIEALTRMHPKTISEGGDYVEGVGYWSYGMTNYLPYLAAMQHCMGETGGLADLPGMRRCGDFPIGSTGPKGFYNFADSSGGGTITAGGFFFLSDYFDDPSYGAFQLNYTSGGGDVFSMLLYSPKPEYSNYLDYMPKYTYTPGNNEVVAVRRSWVDNNAAFLGAKAGAATTWHDHLDTGSYIYDNLGVRWAIELGADDYNHINLYNDGKYAFYRNRAEGQNTLVINPDGKLDQNTGAQYKCVVDEIEVNDSAAYVMMDITKAYEGRGVSSVKRGFAMLNNYGSLLIRDEIQSSKPAEVYAFMHTQAHIEIAPDGKSAILTQNGQKLRARLVGNSAGKLVNMAADPLPTSPNPKEAYPRNGIRKLAVHVENVKSPVINLLLTPYSEDREYEFNLDTVLPLRQWNSYLKNAVKIDNIYLDGVPLSSFSGDISGYVVNEYQAADITCDAPGLDVKIKQAEKLGDTAAIVAKSPKTGARVIYTVTFSNAIQQMMEISSYRPERVWADLSESMVPKVTDNNPSTDWAVDGEADIYFDLGKPKPIEEVRIIWFKGSERVETFSISVSDDANNWREVYKGESYLTDDFEAYKFEPVTARYVKIRGLGNTSNKWTSICEVRVTAFEDPYTDIANHWAKSDIQHMVNVGMITETEEAFNPDGLATRAWFIDLMQRVVGFGKLTYSGKIKDIPPDAEYLGAIEGALDAGIIPEHMLSDGSFMPEQPITGEEMLAIAALACNYGTGDAPFYASLDTFTNKADISAAYIKDVQSAVALRLHGGILEERGGLVPAQSATRAEATVVAKRVYIKVQ